MLALGEDIDSNFRPLSLKPFDFFFFFAVSASFFLSFLSLVLPTFGSLDVYLYRDGPRSTDAANTEHPSDQPFRLVLITSKGVIVCLVVSSFSTSSTSPSRVQSVAPPLELSRSGSWCSGETPTVSLLLPPSPASSTVPSGKVEQRRSSSVPDVGGVVVREREGELKEFHQLVFLRRCFRFTHELLKTAIRG